MTRINRHIVTGALLACSALILAGCGGSSGEARPVEGGAAASTTVAAAGTTARPATAPAENAGPDGEAETGGQAIDSGNGAPDSANVPTEDATAPAPAPTEDATAPTEDSTGLWDPCGLSDADVSAAGLDASTKREIPGAWRPNWLTCRWESSSGAFDLTMESTDRSLDAIRQDPEFKHFAQVFVGGRDALKYISIQDVDNKTCAVSVVVPDGSVMFSVRMHNKATVGEACGHARLVADGVVGHLP
ncbi:DUF3558 domain-containing protein [Nocardia cyriacigeorgica]|uniref:DUF3558 domain-containing protein n=1 Tax=Nocardia cyriacigeorgica TaxID=135487 RepID=A0A6P1DBV7_9NOCA|nr:DUF3558 domain-containing protein [Nocardia cyriacigeorgica]NEW48245.1 DUF3558 domain-containing protein [Nocardia cyriacigeorgica]